MEAKSCAGSGETWNKPLGLLALAISLRTLDFNFDARLLVTSQRQLIGQPARDWSRPTSKGQFPFPLAPEFWGSWNDSWLETSLFCIRCQRRARQL
jgi:hypothetical protein